MASGPNFSSSTAATSFGFGSSSVPSFSTQSFSSPSFGSASSPFSLPPPTKTSTTTTTTSYSLGALPNNVPAFWSSSSSSWSSSSSTLSIESLKAPTEAQLQEPQLSAKISAGNDIKQDAPPSAVAEEGVKSKEGSKETEVVSERPKEEEKEQPSKFTYTRILKGITHNPHFTPLQSYSKRSREKMIAGWDEIFKETIDQIQSLTSSTFSFNVHELLKTIAELDNLGYNVGRLKKRLDELTNAKDKRDSSEVEIKELKTKVEDYKMEKKKIEGEIADLQTQAEKAQVMVDELMDQVRKMEDNLPVVDALFENLAMNPL